MLDCRRCKVKEEDCIFKRDILKSLDIISGYVSSNAIEEIESIIESACGECDDYEKEVKKNDNK